MESSWWLVRWWWAKLIDDRHKQLPELKWVGKTEIKCACEVLAPLKSLFWTRCHFISKGSRKNFLKPQKNKWAMKSTGGLAFIKPTCQHQNWCQTTVPRVQCRLWAWMQFMMLFSRSMFIVLFRGLAFLGFAFDQVSDLHLELSAYCSNKLLICICIRLQILHDTMVTNK